MSKTKKRNGSAGLQYLLALGIIVFTLSIAIGLNNKFQETMAVNQFLYNIKSLQKAIISLRNTRDSAPLSPVLTNLTNIPDFSNSETLPNSVASLWEYHTPAVYGATTSFGIDKNIGFGRVIVRIPPTSYTEIPDGIIVAALRNICLNNHITTDLNTHNQPFPRILLRGDPCVILDGVPIR